MKYFKPYIFEFEFKKYKIKLISTLHNKKDLSENEIIQLINESDEKKICYLLETDYRKSKQEIRKKFGDLTTTIFIREILKKEKETSIKKCIKGWDIRQSLLTQKNQDLLYHNYANMKFSMIENYYLSIIKPRIIEDSNININIKKFLDHNYNQMVNHFKHLIMININHIKNIIKKEDYNMLNGLLLKKYQIKDNLLLIQSLLFQMYAIYSDLFLLENILKNDIDKNYIIFAGEFHYNDIITLINHMKKDNII